VGYNIYRMCSFSTCEENILYGHMDHFACEPNWIRLNTTPVSPEQRHFEDSSTGGMAGCFLYAVRPVGPNRVEGPITKIVVANLASFQPNNIPDGHAKAATILYEDIVPPSTENPVYAYREPYVPREVPVATVLNGPSGSTNGGINGRSRGTYGPAGPPPAVSSVTHVIWEKAGLRLAGNPYYNDTMFATISWNWGVTAPPSDLLGFHVETAGSPSGPWQRLTKHPVAWWEDHYTTQGIGFYRGYNDAQGNLAYSGHMNCLSYRVIAVDEAGNESPPINSNNPLVGCAATPAPPRNLRASDGSTGSPRQMPRNTMSTGYASTGAPRPTHPTSTTPSASWRLARRRTHSTRRDKMWTPVEGIFLTTRVSIP
jgi:hypothetical protein